MKLTREQEERKIRRAMHKDFVRQQKKRAYDMLAMGTIYQEEHRDSVDTYWVRGSNKKAFKIMLINGNVRDLCRVA